VDLKLRPYGAIQICLLLLFIIMSVLYERLVSDEDEDRTCSSGDVLANRQTRTHRETDRHGHHNTPLRYRGRSNNYEVNQVACSNVQL